MLISYLSASQAVELIMLAAGDAMMLPNGHIVIPNRLALAVGRRAIALATPKCLTGQLLVKDAVLAVMVKKQEARAAASARLTELIISGKVPSRGSRTSGGWREDTPSYEYQGLIISEDNAVSAITGHPKIFGVVVDGAALARELGLALAEPCAPFDEAAAQSPDPVQGQEPPKRGGGRKPAAYWAKMEKEAIAWLEENGCPGEGDGEQAKLERYITEELAKRDIHPSEATIGRHISKWVRNRREQLAREGS